MSTDQATDAHTGSRRILDPVVFGTLCGLASSILYTAANDCLWALTDCDSVWVSALKTVPTALLMIPWMLHMHYRGHRAIPPLAVLGVVAVGGFVGQVCGNIPFQWTLGIIHVTADDPPSLIIHGDKDFLVPIQQAEIIVEKLKAANVPAELVVKKGAANGWGAIGKDMPTLADWFDKHLAKK